MRDLSLWIDTLRLACCHGCDDVLWARWSDMILADSQSLNRDHDWDTAAVWFQSQPLPKRTTKLCRATSASIAEVTLLLLLDICQSMNDILRLIYDPASPAARFSLENAFLFTDQLTAVLVVGYLVCVFGLRVRWVAHMRFFSISQKIMENRPPFSLKGLVFVHNWYASEKVSFKLYNPLACSLWALCCSSFY